MCSSGLAEARKWWTSDLINYSWTLIFGIRFITLNEHILLLARSTIPVTAQWLQYQLVVTCHCYMYCINIDSTQYFVNYKNHSTYNCSATGHLLVVGGNYWTGGCCFCQTFSLFMHSWQKLLVRQLLDLPDLFCRPCSLRLCPCCSVFDFPKYTDYFSFTYHVVNCATCFLTAC